MLHSGGARAARPAALGRSSRRVRVVCQHDVVLCCSTCHVRADAGNYVLRRAVAGETGTELDAPSAPPGARQSETEAARRAAGALLSHGARLPESRRAELRARVAAHLGVADVSEGDVAAVAAARAAPPGAGDGGTAGAGGGDARAVQPGAEVVAMLVAGTYDGRARVPGGLPGSAGGVEARLTTFVRRWRVHFLAFNEPRNMPANWSTEYPVCVTVCPPRAGRFDVRRPATGKAT